MREAYNSVSLSSFLMCFVWLYEYLQCYAKLALERVDNLENVYITIKDIKKYTDIDPALLNQFRDIRDDICHGNNVPNCLLMQLITSTSFTDLLCFYNFDEQFIELITKTLKTIVNEDAVLTACRDFVENNASGSLCTIREFALSNYPRKLVDISIILVLRSTGTGTMRAF